MGGTPKIVVPQNGWFIMDTPIKMDDLGENPLFQETPKWAYKWVAGVFFSPPISGV